MHIIYCNERIDNPVTQFVVVVSRECQSFRRGEEEEIMIQNVIQYHIFLLKNKLYLRQDKQMLFHMKYNNVNLIISYIRYIII